MKEQLLGISIEFVLVFLVVYFAYYLIFEDMLKKEKYAKISELGLLIRRFKLDKKKMNYKKCLNGISLINAFIVSFTISVISIKAIPDVVKLIIAFVIMFVMIAVLYTLYGKHLSKKWGEK